jgi:hypothetical protein
MAGIVGEGENLPGGPEEYFHGLGHVLSVLYSLYFLQTLLGDAVLVRPPPLSHASAWADTRLSDLSMLHCLAIT